jgi:hypothetical protein
VYDEREAAAAAVVLDVEPYVMIGVRLATAVDLNVNLLDITMIKARLPPNLPR